MRVEYASASGSEAASRSVRFGDLVEHIVQRVAETPLMREPYPHFQLVGLFPEDVYAALLDSLPPEEAYSPEGYDGKKPLGDAPVNRMILELKDARLSIAPGMTNDQRALWRTVRDALGSPDFKAAVFHKLRAGLAIRYGVSEEEAADVAAYPLPNLYHEKSGYSIAPHPDTRKKIVTMQIALPRDASQSGLGTEFYRRSLNPASLLREPRGFDVVKRMPFVPNACFAFVVLNRIGWKSWHGRTRLGPDCGVRDSILNIWYQKPEQGSEDIVRKFYSPTRAAA